MKYLFIFAFAIVFHSCTNQSPNLKEIEATQYKLEQKIDSLQLQVIQLEELVLTHSEIINGMIESKPGSLLHELENQ